MTTLVTSAPVAADPADGEITASLSKDQPKSFFLFAGAGSGKTRSLVTALNHLRATRGHRLRMLGQHIAVITYTNAACDEIRRRLAFDSLVAVSTIHSFVWELIDGFNADIRAWLETNLLSDIGELQEQLQTGRSGTKAALDRQRSIEAKTKRLAALPMIRRFTYAPNGDNRSRDSLSHAEVIRLGAHFLTHKPVMQQLLVDRNPVLLIDESQDTNGLLMDAFFVVQAAYPNRIVMGLFGDTMQRIYSDGKADLGKHLPSTWATPAKAVNYRCPKRIVRLINRIRSVVDSQEQQPLSDAKEGLVRMFLATSETSNKAQVEKQAQDRMAVLTGDTLWSQPGQAKTLILEHHMAARRMGFWEMFAPLYKIDDFKTGLRDGTLPFVRLFSELVLPIMKAHFAGDEFGVASIVRRDSPLLGRAAIDVAGVDELAQLRAASSAVRSLASLCSPKAQPRFIDVLRCVATAQLLDIPEALQPFAGADDPKATPDASGPASDAGIPSAGVDAIRAFLETPFAQIEPYAAYVEGKAAFSTHQGVKGLEFPRVMVVMDDEEAGGFLFSYEKLFGAKEKTKTDIENERSGKETTIDRTRRLLYVTCSRSRESLALVAYSAHPREISTHCISQGWFDAAEIEFLG